MQVLRDSSTTGFQKWNTWTLEWHVYLRRHFRKIYPTDNTQRLFNYKLISKEHSLLSAGNTSLQIQIQLWIVWYQLDVRWTWDGKLKLQGSDYDSKNLFIWNGERGKNCNQWHLHAQPGRWTPRLTWRDILSNLSILSLSLNCRPGGHFGNLPGPSSPLNRGWESSPKGLIRGEAEPGLCPNVFSLSGTPQWDHTRAAIYQALLLRRSLVAKWHCGLWMSNELPRCFWFKGALVWCFPQFAGWWEFPGALVKN